MSHNNRWPERKCLEAVWIYFVRLHFTYIHVPVYLVTPLLCYSALPLIKFLLPCWLSYLAIFFHHITPGILSLGLIVSMQWMWCATCSQMWSYLLPHSWHSSSMPKWWQGLWGRAKEKKRGGRCRQEGKDKLEKEVKSLWLLVALKLQEVVSTPLFPHIYFGCIESNYCVLRTNFSCVVGHPFSLCYRVSYSVYVCTCTCGCVMYNCDLYSLNIYIQAGTVSYQM